MVHPLGTRKCLVSPPDRRPNQKEKMKLVGCLGRSAIRLAMQNHYYSFGNQIRKQKKGGAIRIKMTERVGKVLMKRQAKKYLSLLEKLEDKIEVLTGYVDDTFDALVSLDPGVRFEDGKLLVREDLVEEDKNIPGDERTMNVLKEIADQVYKCVEFTVDYPSTHLEKSVPVLDLRVYSEGGQILHKFYEKPCASRMVIPHKSAHSRKMKMAVLVKKGIPRLRNHSRGQEWECNRKVMESWSHKLRRIGYPATVQCVMKLSRLLVRGLMRLLERCQCTGLEFGEKERGGWKKRIKAETGTRKKPNRISALLIIDPVAGSMASEMREVCRKFENITCFRVAVQTRAGIANKHLAEPLRRKKCDRTDCFPCSTRGGKCLKNGAGYEIRCETCWRYRQEWIYQGE